MLFGINGVKAPLFAQARTAPSPGIAAMSPHPLEYPRARA